MFSIVTRLNQDHRWIGGIAQTQYRTLDRGISLALANEYSAWRTSLECIARRGLAKRTIEGIGRRDTPSSDRSREGEQPKAPGKEHDHRGWTRQSVFLVKSQYDNKHRKKYRMGCAAYVCPTSVKSHLRPISRLAIMAQRSNRKWLSCLSVRGRLDVCAG